MEPDGCRERDPGRQGEPQHDREGLADPGHRDPVAAAKGLQGPRLRGKWPQEQREDGIVEHEGHGRADHHRRDAEEEAVPELLQVLDQSQQRRRSGAEGSARMAAGALEEKMLDEVTAPRAR